MFLQCKYLRAAEGWELEQLLNDFISKIPRESLIDVKFNEQQEPGEPGIHFVSALIIYQA